MSFLLATDHLSTHLRRPSGLAHRFLQYSGRLYTPSIALAEVYVWAYRRPDPVAALESIDKMLFHEVSVVGYDNDCAKEFGRVRAEPQLPEFLGLWHSMSRFQGRSNLRGPDQSIGPL